MIPSLYIPQQFRVSGGPSLTAGKRFARLLLSVALGDHSYNRHPSLTLILQRTGGHFLHANTQSNRMNYFRHYPTAKRCHPK